MITPASNYFIFDVAFSLTSLPRIEWRCHRKDYEFFQDTRRYFGSGNCHFLPDYQSHNVSKNKPLKRESFFQFT
jgi:hypothetical protein